MGKYMQVDGLMENKEKERNKVKGYKLPVITVIKVNFTIIENLEQEQLSIIMEMFMKDNGKVGKWMVRVSILIKKIQFIIKVNGVIMI